MQCIAMQCAYYNASACLSAACPHECLSACPPECLLTRNHLLLVMNLYLYLYPYPCLYPCSIEPRPSYRIVLMHWKMPTERAISRHLLV